MGPSNSGRALRSGTSRATLAVPPATRYLASCLSSQRSGRSAGIVEHPPIRAVPAGPPNQALKLTRLSPGQLGGSGSAENAAAHWPCTQSAVQLNAGVGPLHDRGAITLDNIIALRYGFRG